MAKSIRKIFTITKAEIDLLKEIRNKGFAKNLNIPESAIVRLGIHLVSQLSNDKLAKTFISSNSMKNK
jgi:hypothetical protein